MIVFFYVLAYAAFPVLALGGVKAVTGNAAEQQPIRALLSKEQSNFVKGLAACLVFLAHSVNYLDEKQTAHTLLLKPLSVFGGMGVLLFFFLSGYGLFKGYGSFLSEDGKPDRPLGVTYWKKRFLGMYVPYLCIKIVSVIIEYGCYQKGGSIEAVINLLAGEWFIDVIMLEYLVFFLAGTIARKQAGRSRAWSFWLINLALDAVLIVVFVGMGIDPHWYNGLLLFPVGMLAAKEEERLCPFLQNGKKRAAAGILLAASFAVTGALFTMWKGMLFADFIKTISGICLSLLVVCIVNTLDFDSRPMKAIGVRSMYVYIIHVNILTMICEDRFFFGRVSAPGNVLCLLLLTIVCTEVFYRLVQLLLGAKRHK